MKYGKKFAGGVIGALLLGLILAGAASGEVISKTFKDIRQIKIKTVSGDCIIKRGSSDEIKLTLTYTFSQEDYEPQIEQFGNRLQLRERFRSPGWGGDRSGTATWALTVPENVDVDFSTASGDLKIMGLKSEIEAGTASGDVLLRQCSGEVSVGTASGEVELEDCDGELKIGTASGDVQISTVSGHTKIGTASGGIRAEGLQGEFKLGTASGSIRARSLLGEMKLSSASGDIEATDVTVTGRSTFSAASGSVEIVLAKNPEDDIKLSSASGDAVLDFNGNKINGYIEMTARVRRGRIRAPFKFDKEDTIYEGDQEYQLKTVQLGSGGPTIEVHTASGDAVIKQ